MSASARAVVSPELPALDPFDPVALEARLVEARVRRAEALAQRAARPEAAVETQAPVSPAAAPVPSRAWASALLLVALGAGAVIAATLLAPQPVRQPPEATLSVSRPISPTAGPDLPEVPTRSSTAAAGTRAGSLVAPAHWLAASPRLPTRLATRPPARPAGFAVRTSGSVPVRAVAAQPVAALAGPAIVLPGIVATIGRFVDLAGARRGRVGTAPAAADDGPSSGATPAAPAGGRVRAPATGATERDEQRAGSKDAERRESRGSSGRGRGSDASGSGGRGSDRSGNSGHGNGGNGRGGRG